MFRLPPHVDRLAELVALLAIAARSHEPVAHLPDRLDPDGSSRWLAPGLTHFALGLRVYARTGSITQFALISVA